MSDKGNNVGRCEIVNRNANNWSEIEELARYAVDDYNKKKNAALKYVNVVEARQQVVEGMLYCITLEAIDGGQKKVYKTKVWVKEWENFKKVEEFKPIGDAPSDSSTTTATTATTSA